MEGKERFEIIETNLSFMQLVSNAPEEITEAIGEKAVIILPSHSTNDSFYSGSLKTLDYFNEHEINTDIYASDEEYKELGLHGAVVWLGTFFITNIVIPVFCSVMSSYIYDKLKAKSGDRISLKFIVEKKNGSSSTVSFDGKVEDLNKVFDAVKRLSDEN